MSKLNSVENVITALKEQQYITDRALATTIFLSLNLQKPILLEGEAGVGKTEVAKVLAKARGSELIRLQCYEGLDVNTAVYEWNYARQLLKIKLEETREEVSQNEIEDTIYSERYLIKRPLLEAIQADGKVSPVLLIDEVDRSDEEFEAFLLEVLSDFQITIPEIGTMVAKYRPQVVLTSNRTRELHEALKRRCLYFWVEYPSFTKEQRILQEKVPVLEEKLIEKICAFMQVVREIDFLKKPGVAESLDWANALIAMNYKDLDRKVISETLGCIFKYREDHEKLMEEGYEKVLSRMEAVTERVHQATQAV